MPTQTYYIPDRDHPSLIVESVDDEGVFIFTFIENGKERPQAAYTQDQIYDLSNNNFPNTDIDGIKIFREFGQKEFPNKFMRVPGSKK